MATKTELITEIVEISKRGDKSTLIGYGIDAGLLDACLEHEFREMEVEADLSASEDDLSEALPSDFHDLLEVRLIDGTQSYPLIVKAKKWITDKFPNIDEDSSSRPDYVYIEDGSLFFSTKLDDDYTIRVTYWKLQTFATVATENPIPVLKNFLVYSGLSFLYNALEMERRGAFWERKARGSSTTRVGGELLRAIRADGRRTAQVRKLEEFQGDRELERSTYFIVPDSV